MLPSSNRAICEGELINDGSLKRAQTFPDRFRSGIFTDQA